MKTLNEIARFSVGNFKTWKKIKFSTANKKN